MKIGDFAFKDDFISERIKYGNFDNYFNCIWNMFITMYTIGYGDFNVRSTISRMLIFIVVLSPLSIIILMLVTYSKYFELKK